MNPKITSNTGRKHAAGMTLIELMTVVVVVAILASVAVASYRNYLMRTNRTEAKMALLRVQTAQEKFFLQNNRYALDAELDDPPPDGLGVDATTPSGYYTITIQTPGGVPNPTTYIATATAAAGQVADTTCPTFTINESGNRTPAVNTGCWR